jgi:fumarylacetoacetate (FAA) hydrolase
VGIINPGEMSTENSIEMVIWVATGGRGTLIGPIIGAGTISNAAAEAGNACITEARVRQMLQGTPEDQLHPYLQDGDRVRIEVRDASVRSVFGAIDQAVRIAELGV